MKFVYKVESKDMLDDHRCLGPDFIEFKASEVGRAGNFHVTLTAIPDSSMLFTRSIVTHRKSDTIVSFVDTVLGSPLYEDFLNKLSDFKGDSVISNDFIYTGALHEIDFKKGDKCKSIETLGLFEINIIQQYVDLLAKTEEDVIKFRLVSNENGQASTLTIDSKVDFKTHCFLSSELDSKAVMAVDSIDVKKGVANYTLTRVERPFKVSCSTLLLGYKDVYAQKEF